jgi:hypothetical protein
MKCSSGIGSPIASTILQAAPVADVGSWFRRRAAYLVVIIAILAVYSYPALRNAWTLKSATLPAVSAPDLGLYLTLGTLETKNGAIENSYYHVSVPAASVGYLKFRSGPWVFGIANRLLNKRLWWTLLLWNFFWWFSLCVATVWLFEVFLPQPNVDVVMVGLCLLLLVEIEGVGHVLRAAVDHAPTWLVASLPYLRPFSPQVVMPLILCYLGLQMRALRAPGMTPWGIMALLQFIAFTAFPYATLMMAGITAVAILWYLPRGKSAWRVAVGFMLVCAAADIAFALHGSAGFRLGFPDQTSLLKFQPFLLSKSIGRLWVLTGLLTTATAITPQLRAELKWPLVGLGLSNMLFVLGDAFVSEPVFFLSAHIGYFYQPTIVILFVFLVSAYLPAVARSSRLTRNASASVIVLCLVYGLLMAEGNYRINLPFNRVQADLASWFVKNKVAANDLVITQFSGTAYDACEWIPLISEAEVLYCRNAQLALTPQQNREVQRVREVLYLYFDGKDQHWLDSATQFEPYGLYGEVSSFRSQAARTQRISDLRREMSPIFERVEHFDPAMQEFFRRFRHVFIIRETQNPAFVDSRLDSYLTRTRVESEGGLVIISATPN